MAERRSSDSGFAVHVASLDEALMYNVGMPCKWLGVAMETIALSGYCCGCGAS
jgi:hypothetical protein